eukprot:CAMPEP_0170536168 /NCGR_PEP_ID=MMETSP0209-20121228/102002_1 /TAXON_ID=665100 ORGANISM="Litonotus pictus, Strain P1" /NCGR_SAMPLE_ID=MMETSP0209 /ASSEMBLY_ACC=CAM_ASM_000301 /LENGTH=632 /DNA_ID=CAMNT_0010837507 /DNA_START=68 /DNA_END=1967 /DNA_ORIENTATION=+
MTDKSGSGHPTSCASMAELMSVLFFHPSGMHFLPKEPRNPANDVFVLSKGHSSPIYYAAWAEAGNFSTDRLFDLRKITSDLEGHPTPRLDFCDFATGSLGQGLANTVGCAYSSKFFDNNPIDFCDFATGSLGQGLANTVGCAYSSKFFDNNPNKYFCLLGDGECAEGSVWEAAHLAGFYKLDNVIAVVDCNRLGQSDVTSLSHETEIYKQRFSSFGFKTIVIDGHDLEQVVKAFTEARNHTGSPVCIVAQTIKGKGFIGDIEDKLNFHGKPMKSSALIENLEKKLVNKTPNFTVTHPTNTFKYPHCSKEQKYDISISYEKDKISTREAFGMAFKKLGHQDGKDKTIVVGLDGDVKNSTFLEPFYKDFPNKFINCYIAEQLLVGAAAGTCKRNKIPFCGTFATFFTRAFDQIRMGAISQDNVKYVGSHSGVHIGEDGPSQMGLEDLALFRSVPGMVVLTPSDGVSAERATELAANHKGSVFIRTGRNAHPILYDTKEKFEVGKSKVLKKGDNDIITVISYGATLFESLDAYEALKKEGINIRVVDLFCVKPIDVEGLRENISQTGNLGFVVEDHYYEGGAGEAVKSALSVFGFKIHHQAVSGVPRSGKANELYDLFGLSSQHLVSHIKKILGK